jgi:uncharacterized protein DUF559
VAEVAPEDVFRRIFEEAERLRLLRRSASEELCRHSAGRRGLTVLRRQMAEERRGATRSPLEDRFVALCKRHCLPIPAVNAPLLDFEVDALWAPQWLVAELDGFAFHHHRAAFERDRARDTALQAAGYRVVRFTHRRLEREPDAVAGQLRALLAASLR